MSLDPKSLLDIKRNDETIQLLNYDKKVMAEEVLHGNGEHSVKILPTQPVPDELPPKEAMVKVLHRNCEGGIAFYYTHTPKRGEIMTAARARNIDGKPIEPGSPMRCGSCGAPCGNTGSLYISKEGA